MTSKPNIVHLLDNLRQLERRVSIILADTALTLSQFRLLCILYYGNTPQLGTSLSTQLGVSKASITVQLKALAEAGQIEVKLSTTDKRASLISLSNAGRQRMKVTLENLTILEKQISPEVIDLFLEGFPHLSTTKGNNTAPIMKGTKK